MKISFIGYGNMAKAIAKYWTTHPNVALYAASPHLTEGITQEGLHTHPNNCVVAENAKLIVIATKPNQATLVLDEIRDVLHENTVILSICAGLTLETLEKHLPNTQAVVVSMPNLPIEARMGVTALMANHNTTPEQKKTITSLFQTSGIVTWVQSNEAMWAMTALSGSGPAYVCLFLEALIEGALALGLDQKIATECAKQTLSGTLALLETRMLSPETLRKKITSPQGTTASALDILTDLKFKDALTCAMKSAYKKASELAILGDKK